MKVLIEISMEDFKNHLLEDNKGMYLALIKPDLNKLKNNELGTLDFDLRIIKIEN